ncbi:MAG: response regulator transcription factor [Chloroflexi bacterium]|nr:response regulator transcription factor [Chloroflexota bacterium]
MSRVRVFIADRHALFREGVRAALAATTDLEMCGEGSPEPSALPAIAHAAPAVLLVGLAMPETAGLELIRQAKEHLPGVAVVAMACQREEQHLFHVVAAGAVAYVCKDITADRLTSLVRAVANGEYPLSDYIMIHPDLAPHPRQQFQGLLLTGNAMPGGNTPLSPREAKVLSCILSGYSNKQIAATLRLSEQTVKNSVSVILRKLDASDRTQAVVRALREGWLSLWAP